MSLPPPPPPSGWHTPDGEPPSNTQPASPPTDHGAPGPNYAPPPSYQQPPNYGPPPGYPQPPAYGAPPGYQQAYQYGQPPLPMPDNHLVWAILTTIFCCLPFGIVSIVMAAQVSGLWSTGQWQAAHDKARSAKRWAIAGAATGLGILMVYILFIIILAASSSS